MKYEDRRHRQASVILLVFIVSSLGFLNIFAEQGSMRQPNTGNASQITFKGPDQALVQWNNSNTTVAVKNAAVEYLERIASDDASTPAEFSRACAALASIYNMTHRQDKVIELHTRQLEKEKDPKAAFTISMALYGAYKDVKDYGNATKVLADSLGKYGSVLPPATVSLRVQQLASMYSENMGLNQEAAKVLSQALKNLPEDAVVERAGISLALADLYSEKFKDVPKAEAEYAKIVEAGEKSGFVVLSSASMKLAQLYAETGRSEKAASLFLSLLKIPSSPSAAIAEKLLGLEVNPKQLEEASWSVRARISAQLAGAAPVSTTETIDALQGGLVKLLSAAGKTQEALQEARIYFYASSQQSMPAAIDLVAGLFKASDLNLVRANGFLKYLKYGPAGEDGKIGTQDDLRDLLKDIPPIADDRRTQLYRDAMAALPRDWMGYQSRARVHIFLDQPAEAFKDLRKSFELCPMTEKELQVVVDAMTGFVIRNLRDVQLAESVTQYIMFGAGGKDGREGTPDDIKDPVPEIMKRLGAGASSKPVDADKPAQK